MLLEGKIGLTVSTVMLAGILAAWNAMGPVMQDLVLAAAAIAALRIIGGQVMALARGAREVHAAVTARLPARMEQVEARLDDGAAEFAAIRTILETYGATEAAAMRGVVQGVSEARKPRSARASDAGQRTGWRE